MDDCVHCASTWKEAVLLVVLPDVFRDADDEFGKNTLKYFAEMRS